MHARLAPQFREDPRAREAAEVLGRCVHCGFCTATCPTYQLLGDELDGPRGRIHLVKQLLEGEPASAVTRLHLDRCLTCRACETSCPSGVEYGHLLEAGRQLIEQEAPRSRWERVRRRALARFLTGPAFAPLLRVGQVLRPLLPASLARHVPALRQGGAWPARAHSRRVVLLRGCVQPALSPNIDAATARVLDALGIQVQVAASSGCCGAIEQHLSFTDSARERARRNIDAWWPAIESGAEAIAFNASGCGTSLRDYGHLLADDPRYAPRAQRVAALARDLVEILAPEAARLGALLRQPAESRIAFHPPCSLQHGLKLKGAAEAMLSTLGARLLPVADAHLCCGSAGTYSLLQPEISSALGNARAAALAAPDPQLILSANIGCIRQLAVRSSVPVMHWIEWIDSRLGAQRSP